jgi:hypothetical protein
LISNLSHNNTPNKGRNNGAELGEEVQPKGSMDGVLFYCFFIKDKLKEGKN